MQKETRELTLKETKSLKKIRATNERILKRGYSWANAAIAFVLAVVLLYGATWTRYDLITFLLGTLSVFSLGYAFFTPFEMHKEIRKARRTIRNIDDVLNTGTVEVTPVVATRIALAKEYEDEGDLYLVEMDDDRILYIVDIDHNLRKGFPCLHFELYSDTFYNLVGRQINPLSEKIKPIIVDAESKWKYFKKSRMPVHLETKKTNFDRLLEKINNMAK